MNTVQQFFYRFAGQHSIQKSSAGRHSWVQCFVNRMQRCIAIYLQCEHGQPPVKYKCMSLSVIGNEAAFVPVYLARHETLGACMHTKPLSL